jgi:polysaccharide chain length determinant protein (PEP-CTERM system associated)
MPPTVQQQQAPEPFNVQRYVEILRRRHMLFLIPLLAGWLAVWGASWILPPRYKSSTLILVEQPTMPKDYVLPNVAENLQEQLQSITQQILSRSRLLHIVDELNLYPKERTRLSPDEIVAELRKNVDVELVRGADDRISAFNVYYTAGDPQVAQRVTSKLTNLFINENLEIRQQESEGNTKFLEDQLQAAQQSLQAQEQQVRQFKAEHVGQLPSQLNSNLQILAGLQSQMQAESEALNTTKQQRVYLESLLSQYRALKGPSKDSDSSQMGLTDVDEQINKLHTQLRNLTSTYTDKYPEVRRVKDEIAKAEAQRERIVAELKKKASNAQADGKTTVSVYEGAEAKDPSLLPQLQSQLQANQAEIKNREQAIAGLAAKINEYQGRLNQEPVREQQLADLTRGYNQSKASYDDLLKKKNDSAMATSMELLQQGQRFRIIDPPSLPLKPSFPNRLKFCGIGLLVGLALGAGCVWSAEAMDDRVYSESELRKLLPVSVISELPVISDPKDAVAERNRTWFGWATATVIVAVILAGSAVSYLRG